MDVSQIARELEIDESEYISLLKLFEKHARTDMTEIHSALAQSDPRRIHTAAHSIKGSSGSLALWDIHEAASAICVAANQGGIDSISDHVRTIEEQVKTISVFLDSGDGGDAS